MPVLCPGSESKIQSTPSLDLVSMRIMLENGEKPLNLVKLSQINENQDLKRHLQYIINYVRTTKKLNQTKDWETLQSLIETKLG